MTSCAACLPGTIRSKRSAINSTVALDALILEFVFHKLELYKKLTEPDTNAMFKQKWFEELYRKYRS